MTYIAEGIFLIVNVLMAWYHAELIEDGKKIKHGLWGGGYLIAAIIFSWVASWWLLPSLLLMRKVVFDTALNIFRGKPIFYVSASTKSIADQIHNWLFRGKSEVYMPIYLIVLVLLNIFFL